MTAPDQPPAAAMLGSAILSDDGQYRYSLNRLWDNDNPRRALWLMLNPSTADATRDDPTIRRCIAFSRAAACGGLTVVNLYAYRATKPADMWAAQSRGVDIIGPDNDGWIAAHAKINAERDGLIFAAFGTHGEAQRIWKVTRGILRAHDLHCLGVTASGAPRHPLYVRGETAPTRWPS